MPQRKITLAPNEYYHIYNRGVDKRKIFNTKRDYDRFLALLFMANSSKPIDLKLQGRTLYEIARVAHSETLVDICIYCLMPNHFHFLIREKSDSGISKFMQKLTTAYTMYFNKCNDRNGSLFQGRFKATHADSDQYLSYLISYIHLNPVKLIDAKWKENGIRDKKSAEKYLEGYQYSSFQDYLGVKRLENKIINPESLPEYFETPKEFKHMVTEWLNYNP